VPLRKVSKDKVNYGPGHKDSHCGKCFSEDTGYCKNYMRIKYKHVGNCRVVQGEVKSTYWCNKFEKAK
jgi:hypothetical protein